MVSAIESCGVLVELHEEEGSAFGVTWKDVPAIGAVIEGVIDLSWYYSHPAE